MLKSFLFALNLYTYVMTTIQLENSKPLIILEIANNHFGSVNIATQLLSEFSKFLVHEEFKFAVKFQYRHLDSLIHNKFKGNHSFKYIKRFEETALTPRDFIRLKKVAKDLGFETACTPFDEKSVELVLEHDYDYLKIASASLTDWPLLEKISTCPIPVIASTAGYSIQELRKVVTFLGKRNNNLSLMHCVAIYPAEMNQLNLDRIDLLKSNFRNYKIGYSAHEKPDNILAGSIAYSKGARIFEKHIGISSNENIINEYSCSPEQLANWLIFLKNSMQQCGNFEKSNQLIETKTLNSLRRGVYLKNKISKNQLITEEDIYFAIPTVEDQILANDWSKFSSWITNQSLEVDNPLLRKDISESSTYPKIESIVNLTLENCKNAGAIIPSPVTFEISHHYGLDRFDLYGMVLVPIVNREYCKKLIVIQPGQTNPEHYHKLKEETFFCLFGELIVIIENQHNILLPGDLLTIPTGTKHILYSKVGAVVEEISSTSYSTDSYYTDKNISAPEIRKTNIKVWS